MRGHRDRAVGTLCLVVERALVNPSVLGVKRRARSLPATTANHAVSCPPCRTRRSASASSTLGTPEPRWSSPTYTCSTSSPTTITNPATVPSIWAIVVSGSRCAARLQKDGSRPRGLSAPQERARRARPATPGARSARSTRISSAVAARRITSSRGAMAGTLSTLRSGLPATQRQPRNIVAAGAVVRTAFRRRRRAWPRDAYVGHACLASASARITAIAHRARSRVRIRGDACGLGPDRIVRVAPE